MRPDLIGAEPEPSTSNSDTLPDFDTAASGYGFPLVLYHRTLLNSPPEFDPKYSKAAALVDSHSKSSWRSRSKGSCSFRYCWTSSLSLFLYRCFPV